jgi:hypothetical protein
MSTKMKVIILILIVVVTAAVVVFFALQSKVNAEGPDDGIIFPIMYGSQGEHVKLLQQAANYMLEKYPESHDFEKLAIDGFWGNKTSKALYFSFGIGDEGVSKQKYYNIINLLA